MSEPKHFAYGNPADFSFRRLHDVEEFMKSIGLESARFTRIGKVPERGPEKKKFLTKSIWLNNNKLKTIKNMDELVESVLEYPDQLGWIDFSFNFITEIDECILKYADLKILYFHGNCIANLEEILKLKPLKQLRSLTFQGNPIANLPNYRQYVISALPQLQKLDFSPIIRNEKLNPPPPELIKKLKEDHLKKK